LLNPYYALAVGQRFETERNRFLSTATLRYDLTDWLYVQGRYNYDFALTFTESHDPGGIGTSVPTNADGTYKGAYNLSQNKGTDVNADFLVGGGKAFGKFSVDANVGGNTWRVKNNGFNQGSTNFIVRDLYSIGNGSVRSQGYGFSQYRVNSLYGWAELGYNNLLYLNFTGRQDWFSVLNPEDNSELYQSVSGSFIFSELLKNQKWQRIINTLLVLDDKLFLKKFPKSSLYSSTITIENYSKHFLGLKTSCLFLEYLNSQYNTKFINCSNNFLFSCESRK
jgi:hypothetical protein